MSQSTLFQSLEHLKCKGYFRNDVNMFSFVRHSDGSKFSEGSTCLHIRVILSLYVAFI